MIINLIPFHAKNIVDEGFYLVQTKTKFNTNMFLTKVTNPTGNKMVVDCTNQIVTHISSSPINRKHGIHN